MAKKRTEKTASGTRKSLDDKLEMTLGTLPPLEESVLRLRFGIGDGIRRSLEELADRFGLSKARIRQVEVSALRRMRHPILSDELRNLLEEEKPQDTYVKALREVIETVKNLTPDLIIHLRKHTGDIRKIHWDVFEHLVAEFFASWGYQDVRLVGRDKSTSADIFAVSKPDQAGVQVRLYVEVKRWRDNIGVEVIDQVLGAIRGEREKHGWDLGMIVSSGGFSDMHKYSLRELTYKGIQIRSESDVVKWLTRYEPNSRGLWLPNPKKIMPSHEEDGEDES